MNATAVVSGLEPLTKEDRNTIIETSAILFDDYVTNNILQYMYPDFHDDACKTVLEVMTIPGLIPNIDELIEVAAKQVYRHICPRRSYNKSFIRKPPDITYIADKINVLSHKFQPAQRTPAWYEFRHNMLTASSAWKAFGTNATINQLICGKCLPLNISKYNSVYTDSPLHHGERYEPVSIMYYEDLYNTKVGDFGCIRHSQHSFLGASPDGINIDEKSDRFGRMLEVKNIVNRVINGNPKMEYWIQMQLQMETCDLNECDFLETQFKEYESKAEFDQDGNFTETENGELKGIIMYFIDKGKPIYEYSALKINEKEFYVWEEAMMKKYEGISWLKNIYWKLFKVSSVLVIRNKLWFKAACPILHDTWEIIKKEKITGFAHRAPKKKRREICSSEPVSSKCYIKTDVDATKIISIKTEPFTL